jgi:uncharacterized protein YccT (UPF0319 family)
MTKNTVSVKPNSIKGAEMRKPMLMAGFLILSNSMAALAENITFPQEIIPLQVNEKVLESGLFDHIDDIDLDPGTYKLKLKYSDLYEQGYDEHQIIESEPFWVRVIIEEDIDYTLVFNRANNAVTAKVFAQSPTVSLQADNSAISEPVEVISDNNTVPTVSESAADENDTLPSQSMSTGQAIKQPSALSMLDFWWQQATPTERAAFLEKIKD